MSNWKVQTITDAYQERLPVRYAVTGMIEIPSISIIYGAPSTLKSMFLLDLGMNLVRGNPWLKNEDGIPSKLTVKTPVLWVDFDNGKRRTADRVKAVGKHYGATAKDDFFYISMPVGGLDMSNLNSYQELEDAISECIASGGVVVVDNLGCVLGNIDENSHGMASIMSNFRVLSERHQIAFVIIHHQRKGKGDSAGRAGDSLRGHSSIEAALDLALLVEREEGSNRVNIRATKTRGYEVKPFSAYFRSIGDELELKEAWFVGLDSNSIERRTEKAVLKFLRQGEKNKGKLEELCKAEDAKITPTRVDAAIASLLKTGLIGEKKGDRKEKIFFLRDAEQMQLHYNPEIVPTASSLGEHENPATEEA
jgi:hypothetical protein